MNPSPLVLAILRRDTPAALAFVVLIAIAVGIGAALTAQERALRSGSARAADPFDLVVAAPGSAVDRLLEVVYLRSGPGELLSGEALARVLADDRAAFAAPVGFGDSHAGEPVVGTSADLVNHLAGRGRLEGRPFAAHEEAVVGARSQLAVGDNFAVTHGHGAEALLGDIHPQRLTVVGRLPPLGSPWDRAILVPIEFVWEVHATHDGAEEPNEAGHAPSAHEAEEDPVGPPFDLEHAPGVSAVVMKPKTVADAYGLRSRYQTAQTSAFFPAEALTTLYELLGDARLALSVMTVATVGLLILAILAGLVLLLRLYGRRFAILRALGAPRAYIFLVVWLVATLLVAVGSLLGLGLAAAFARLASAVIAERTGIALSASLGREELLLVGLIACLGAFAALVPAALLFRRPAASGLDD